MILSASVLSDVMQACKNLSNLTNLQVITDTGNALVQALGVTLIAWEGMMMALSAATGHGINLPKFASTVFQIMIVYVFVHYYNSSIPGMSYSIKTVISGTAADIAGQISDQSTGNLENLLSHNLSLMQGQFGLASLTAPIALLGSVLCYLEYLACSAIVICVVAYGVIAATVCAILGPLFIPFLLIKQLDWLFWGWLRSYIGFCFYQVVAACVLWIISNILSYELTLPQFQSPDTGVVSNVIAISVLLLTAMYCTTKIPAITGSLFSGHVGGHGGLEQLAGQVAGAAVKVGGVGAAA